MKTRCGAYLFGECPWTTLAKFAGRKDELLPRHSHPIPPPFLPSLTYTFDPAPLFPLFPFPLSPFFFPWPVSVWSRAAAAAQAEGVVLGLRLLIVSMVA